MAKTPIQLNLVPLEQLKFSQCFFVTSEKPFFPTQFLTASFLEVRLKCPRRLQEHAGGNGKKQIDSGVCMRNGFLAGR
ncbi:CLUMA_CG011646, isoform A [Clunio marinus]|uniref:CLUMA_CG011646, isoform A n=1 Tax=Clunio marinus TaxID=568069 RepID=A0A1J1IFF6_9DIPT|nr:CLUMA_CG011646, isoform A [Clunio marinus]